MKEISICIGSACHARCDQVGASPEAGRKTSRKNGEAIQTDKIRG